MKVIVIFESMFGNTKILAQDVRDGLADAGADVAVVGVVDAAGTELVGCDLVVLAAPTHALSLSRPQTRADAVKKGADPDCASTGIREWLDNLGETLPATSVHPPVAVLDTRVRKARHWSGSAAKRAARTLRKDGFQVVEQMSFYVEGVTGPVTSGEHLRARMWGRHLAEMVPHPAAS
jgi:flavorubredoxin